MEDADILSPELRKALANDAHAVVVRDESAKQKEKKRKKVRKRKRELGALNTPPVCTDPVARPQRAVPSRKKHQRGAEVAIDAQRAAKKSRAAEEKAKRARAIKDRRAVLLAKLQEHTLSSEEQQLLRPSAAVGTKDSLKTRLTHELRMERAGLAKAHSSKDNQQVSTAQEPAAESQDGEQRKLQRRVEKGKRRREVNDNKPRANLVVPIRRESSDEGSDESSDESSNENSDNVENNNENSNNDENSDGDGETNTIHDAVARTDSITATGGAVRVHEKDVQSVKISASQTTSAPRVTPTSGLHAPATAPARPPVVVRPARPDHIQASRRELPVCGMEQEIMEAIQSHPVTVLCGDTGSGKTTQVPQFLVEAGFGWTPAESGDAESGETNRRGYHTHHGLVAVTQPRRVAAVSMAHRVATELGTCIEAHPHKTKADRRSGAESTEDPLRGAVGYQVRYDSETVGKATRVKFMTDGVLLREAKEDLLLRRYSVIVLDEAHERNLNTDILLGLLSRIVPLRAQMVAEQKDGSLEPLRLIIMSATLRVDDFVRNERLFQSNIAQSLVSPPHRELVPGVDGPYPPKVISVNARQHPVTPHFSRRTELNDYVGAAFRKTCAIHRRLPAGGVLVFLTGQREIEWFVAALRTKFNPPPRRRHAVAVEAAKEEEPAFAPVGENADEQEQQTDGVKVGGSDNDSDDGSENDDDDEDADGDADGDEDGDDDVDYSDIDDSDDEEREQGDHSESDSDTRNNTSTKDFAPKTAKRSKELNEEEKEEELRGVRGGNAHQPLDSGTLRNSENKSGTSTNNGGSEDFGANCDLEPELGVGRVHVLPLYARLPPKQQMKVFQSVPRNHRLIVVATNVAETSITIPNIQYVVDCGREKVRVFDQYSNTSRFKVDWISQASGNQRMGRAGRVGPGHCYRLYSSTVFHEFFQPFSRPEIARVPIDDLVLYMKSLGIRDVGQFPFPTRPDPDALRACTLRLMRIGALRATDQDITDMGERMAALPVNARFAKVLVATAASTTTAEVKTACALDLLRHGVVLVAIQSVPSPFLTDQVGTPSKDRQNGEQDDDDDDDDDDDEDDDDEEDHPFWREDSSDALSLLKVAGAYLHTHTIKGARAADKFCAKHGLHAKTMREMIKLRGQLAREASKMMQSFNVAERSSTMGPGELTTKLLALPRPPSEQHCVALRQAVVSGLLDQVARKMDATRARAVMRGHTQYTLRRSWPYETCSATGPRVVYVHPRSNVYSHDARQLPEWAVFTEISETVRRVTRSRLEKEHAERMAGSGNGTTGAASAAAGGIPAAQGGAATADNHASSEVVQNYMLGVTALEPQWLWRLGRGTGSQCLPGKPLESPMPRYDAGRDRVVCCIRPLFGYNSLRLPSMWVAFEEVSSSLSLAASATACANADGADGETATAAAAALPDADYASADAVREHARWFARALLDGQVEPALDCIKKWLAAPSITVIKAKHQPRVERLVNALLRGVGSVPGPILSRAALKRAWRKQPGFLRAEVLLWVRSEHKDALKDKWRQLR